MVSVGQSVLLNDNDPDGSGAVSIFSYDSTSVNGGSVVLAADGSFTYYPAAGYSGTDTFTYTVHDVDDNADFATVSIAVGPVVWFINNAVGGPGDGRFTSPFKRGQLLQPGCRRSWRLYLCLSRLRCICRFYLHYSIISY